MHKAEPYATMNWKMTIAEAVLVLALVGWAQAQAPDAQSIASAIRAKNRPKRRSGADVGSARVEGIGAGGESARRVSPGARTVTGLPEIGRASCRERV